MIQLSSDEILSEKINFEIYNDLNLREDLDHNQQKLFINNDYSGSDIEDLLQLRKSLIYANNVVNLTDLNFFTISSKFSFSSILKPDSLTWNKCILFSPLNNHSRSSLRKGDILFCNRMGQFSDLNEALNMRGIYGVGIAIEDPQIYFPTKTNHERFGIKIVFPFSLQKNLSTREIQLNPVTIAQTPYNGNMNDALQKINSKTIALELLKMISLKNPDFQTFLKVFYNYSIPSFVTSKTGINSDSPINLINSIDPLKEFIKWFQIPENYRKSYDGLLDYDLLKSWDNLFFGGKIFTIRFDDIAKSIAEITEILKKAKDNSKWANFSQACSKGAPGALLGENNYLRFLNEYEFDKVVTNPLRNDFNRIIYGAPGTGKSQRIVNYFKKNHINEQYIERIVFHPEMDYHSFVGGYKPITRERGDEIEIRYEYVPQSFLKLLLKAIKDPTSNYYLVIEEINRGNCAEIFGDMFQLLDRKPEYMITPSTELELYITEKERKDSCNYLINGKLNMPKNLILFATMNTSDQSLYPMDSAFKRRWDWQYESILYPMDENDLSNDSFLYYIQVDEGVDLQWVHFMKVVNDMIAKIPGLGMDKCLGNFFIKPKVGNLIDGEEFVNKVIFYLWNDVLKEEINPLFNGHQFQAYLPYKNKGVLRLNEFIEEYGNKYKYEEFS